MSRRSVYDITHDILELAKVPVRVTNIVYGCNLNFDVVQPYIQRLTDKQLLVVEDVKDTRFYVTTDHGRAFVEAMNRVKEVYNAFPEPGVPVEGVFVALPAH